MDSDTEVDDAKIEEPKVVRVDNVTMIQELRKSEGYLMSPINLNLSEMEVMNLMSLRWLNYSVMPKKMKLTNTGHTVILSAKWHQERPFLASGPFLHKYVFGQIHFHWSAPAMTGGSEHSIDGSSMPMELHVVHFKSEFSSLSDAMRKTDGVIILVYLFKDAPNALLKEVISSLPFIRQAHSSVRLVPMLMTTIVRPFQDDYFLYWGCIATDALVHTVLWLISREPIGISIAQATEFRTLSDDKNRTLLTTCRPLQERQGRHIFHVNPSGSRYATLLPIPREPPFVASTVAAIKDRLSVEES